MWLCLIGSKADQSTPVQPKEWLDGIDKTVTGGGNYMIILFMWNWMISCQFGWWLWAIDEIFLFICVEDGGLCGLIVWFIYIDENQYIVSCFGKVLCEIRLHCFIPRGLARSRKILRGIPRGPLSKYTFTVLSRDIPRGIPRDPEIPRGSRENPRGSRENQRSIPREPARNYIFTVSFHKVLLNLKRGSMKVNIMFHTHQFYNLTHTIHNVYTSCITMNVDAGGDR